MSVLEDTVKMWSGVQKENARDRKMVTQNDWATWERVDKKVTDTLAGIIDRSRKPLTTADENLLKDIKHQVESATRRTGRDLESYAREHGLIETTSKPERKRLLGLIGR